MAIYEFFNEGTNSTYTDNVVGGGYYGGGGGASTGGNSTTIPAQSRTISFQINSSPQGGVIFVDGQSTQYTTPYTLQFTELELLSPKRITVVNGNSNSVEAYVLSSQKVTNTTTTGGGSGGGGGSYGGGYSGGGFNPGDPNNNVDYLGDRLNLNQR